MDCQICELHQKRFYCVNCLRDKLHDYKNQLAKLAKERDAERERADLLYKSIEGPRIQRAEITQTESRTKELIRETDRLRKANDSARKRVAALRTQLATRRANLLTARSFDNLSNSRSSTSDVASEWAVDVHEVHQALIKARISLVQELTETFDLNDIDISPNQGYFGFGAKNLPNLSVRGAGSVLATGSALLISQLGVLNPAKSRIQSSLSKWSISGLVIPLPEELRQATQNGSGLAVDDINAAIVYTLQFMNLLCFYLGVKLPFEVHWSGGKPSVGVPLFRAGPGTSSGNWSKWSTPCALYLPPVATSGAPSASSAAETFSIAYCMLAYNICYLSYTQAISIPLTQSGNLLANLWHLCTSPGIGRFSHQTSSSSVDLGRQAATYTPATISGVGVSHPLHHDRVLAPPTPVEFGLDFEAVLEQLTGKRVQPPTQGPHSLGDLAAVIEEEAGDGWAMVDFEGDNEFHS